MSALRLQFIGCGKMGEALLAGLASSGWAAYGEMAVAEKLPQRRQELSERYPDILVSVSPQPKIDAVLAVKPNDVAEALVALKAAGVSRVLSVAAGVTINALTAGLPPGSRVLRAMPNTPALLSHGAAALAPPGGEAEQADIDWACEILGSVGIARVVGEEFLNAVTGLSGSGPAYVFLLAEALIAAGVAEGLDADTADALVRQTIYGAGAMLALGNRSPADLRKDVTSPGGTTAAGIASLERDDFSTVVSRAVSSATRRSSELG